MKMKRTLLLLFTIFSFTVFGCSPLSAAPDGEPQETVVSEPTALPAPTETPVPSPAFEAVTYRDETAGFEFDYPAGWAIDAGEEYSRGSNVQFFSWDWKPGDPIDPLLPGRTVLSVTLQDWDPKNDLEAFIDQRKLAWDSSGISIITEERPLLSGDRPAAQYTVQGVDGAQAYFLFTTLGEQYLSFSGSGELALLAEIAHTLRPLQ
jgi:hypothetical protein